MVISLWARLLFGFSLLYSAIIASSYTQALITLTVAILTMLLLNQLSLLWRALRYLRWLLLPVILLHILFTPGMLLAPSLPWSPSHEGAEAALWQSLRLINWFLSGWLLAYLLSHQEWLHLLTRLPRMGSYWAPFLMTLPPMLQRSKQALTLMRWRWQHERGKWSDIPSVASTMVVTMLAQGASQAEAHWLSSPPIQEEQPKVVLSLKPLHLWPQTVLVGIGWAVLWAIW